VSWHPSDLVSDIDLVDYEQAITSQFGPTHWTNRRTKALEDWLFPILKTQGIDPDRIRTRAQADNVFGYTASTFSDLTSNASSETADDLNLATVFATVGTDALYIGSDRPFRGVFVRMLDSVSAITSALTVAYWNGAWTTLPISNGTAKTSGKTFSGGGSITWTLPVDWQTRVVNGAASRYVVKLTVSATPTGALATQLGVIRASALRAPVTFRTLELIFREAPTGHEGPWQEKADYYAKEAEAALQRALLLVGGEIDTDEDDLISPEEEDQTTEAVGGGWRLERA
jgi:hypothetical protein